MLLEPGRCRCAPVPVYWLQLQGGRLAAAVAETIASRCNQWPTELGHLSVRHNQFRLPLLPAGWVGTGRSKWTILRDAPGGGRDVHCCAQQACSRVVYYCSTRRERGKKRDAVYDTPNCSIQIRNQDVLSRQVSLCISPQVA